MKNLLLISPQWEDIKANLINDLTAVTISGCKDVYELYDKTQKTFLRYDVLLMRDNALVDQTSGTCNLAHAGSILYQLLKEEFFEVKRIIILVEESKKDRIELFEGIKSSSNINSKTKIDIIVNSQFKYGYLRDLLTNVTKHFEEEEVKYKYVIKKKRNDIIGEKLVETRELSVPVKVLMPQSKTNIKDIKDEVTDIYQADTVEDIIKHNDVEKIEIEELDIQIDNIIDIKNDNKKGHTTLVTGESKSGVSTTAMVLGVTASKLEKTLIIDMNWTNLGLSYLAEKTLVPSAYHELSITEYITDEKLEKLKNDVYNNKQLHIMTLKLPIKSLISRIDYAFILDSILTYAKGVYDRIIIDAPIQDLMDYRRIIKHVDKLILTSQPYINNIVSLATTVKKIPVLMNSHLMLDLKVDDKGKDAKDKLLNTTLLRTVVFRVVNKNIKPITRQLINVYFREIIGCTMDITSMYVYKGESYRDEILFNQLYYDEGTNTEEINIDQIGDKDNTKTGNITNSQKKAKLPEVKEKHNIDNQQEQNNQQDNKQQSKQPNSNKQKHKNKEKQQKDNKPKRKSLFTNWNKEKVNESEK